VKTAKLHDLSTDQLVESFIEVCLAQDEALLDGEIAKFNRLFDNMRDVVEELRSRAGDQRQALLPLYKHPNLQVRLKAATNTLAVARDEAQKLLRMIANSGEYPQAGEAGMTLANIERGIFKPA
jgi:ParB-like chromosome segregation protein Spo0J